MNDIWRGDRDDLNIRILDESTPIGSPTEKAELFGG